MRAAAQAAIARLTGRPFAAQPRTPVRVLTDAAWDVPPPRVEFPDDRVVVWSWDDDRKVPVAARGVGRRGRGRSSACGSRARPCGWTRTIDRPRSRSSAWPWRRPSSGSVPTRCRPRTRPPSPRRPPPGPSLLGEVLETAIADGKTDLAAVAVTGPGKVTDRTALATGGRPHPLVRALSAPGRRVQFAAARALVELAPDRPFPGSSLVVPTLARFVVNQPQPRAVVIDGNANRGGLIAGFLMNLGYHHVQERDRQRGLPRRRRAPTSS